MNNKPTSAQYKVTVRFQYPAWDETYGFTYEVSASSKSAANKYARWKAECDGHVTTGKGRIYFTAEKM